MEGQNADQRRNHRQGKERPDPAAWIGHIHAESLAFDDSGYGISGRNDRRSVSNRVKTNQVKKPNRCFAHQETERECDEVFQKNERISEKEEAPDKEDGFEQTHAQKPDNAAAQPQLDGEVTEVLQVRHKSDPIQEKARDDSQQAPA